MSNTYSHAGDIGDIIYSLPAIRAKGGGDLVLFDSPGKTSHGMSEEKVDRIRPLLELQDYIGSVTWSPEPYETPLNGFRDHHHAGNLADKHLATMGLSWEHRQTQWLHHVQPAKHAYDVIIHRSERYRNDRFPWKSVCEHYDGQIGFMGFPQEHADFCIRFSDVPFVPASDLLQVASVISGSKLFIGNQSSPLAIAYGLHHDIIMEISPGNSQHDCVFQRMNCIIGWDEKLELPEL